MTTNFQEFIRIKYMSKIWEYRVSGVDQRCANISNIAGVARTTLQMNQPYVIILFNRNCFNPNVYAIYLY